MKYILILIIMTVLSGVFHYLFGEHDALKRGIFIGFVFGVGYLFGWYKK